MRTCPECGYHDGIYWRPRLFDVWVDIASLEDVERMNPSLASRLKSIPWGQSKTLVHDGIYVYRVTKSGMVWRIERDLWRALGKQFTTVADGAGTRRSAAYKKAVERISGGKTTTATRMSVL
jgi:hypothetical protein